MFVIMPVACTIYVTLFLDSNIAFSGIKGPGRPIQAALETCLTGRKIAPSEIDSVLVKLTSAWQ